MDAIKQLIPSPRTKYSNEPIFADISYDHDHTSYITIYKFMLDDSLTRAESHETYSLVLDSQLFEILPQLRV